VRGSSPTLPNKKGQPSLPDCPYNIQQLIVYVNLFEF